MNERLEPLLNPSSIALIGASNNPGRIGGLPLELLTTFKYRGDIYPINPKYDEVFGLRCWPDIESIPKAVDLVVLAISASDVVPMLQRCHEQGAKAAIVYAAGFAEEGSPEGVALQSLLTQFASETGMVVAGPNCMGLANLNTQAHTAFASVFKTAGMQTVPGNISLLTQSGNVCAAVYSLLRQLDLSVAQFINTGNEACVDFSDYLAYLAQDPNTDVVVGYIEQIRDGKGFIQACAELQKQDKVLIALKAGATEKGALAVQSHTSALAGDDRIYAAAFRQLGVIQADDFAQMAHLAQLVQLRSKSAGTRLAVVTMSGALGAILADRFTEAGLELPDLSSEVQVALRKGIPTYGMVTNPVDVTGNVVNDPEFVRDVLEALAVSPDLDVVVIYAPGYMLDRMADSIVDVARLHPRLFVAIDTGAAECRARLAAAGVAVFDDIGRAVSTLGPFLRWKQDRQNVTVHAGTLEHQPRSQNLTALSLPADEVDALRYLAGFGVASSVEYVATTAQEAVGYAEKIGFPVVLKVVSVDIPHKTEVNGVRLNLESAADVEEAFTSIMDTVREILPGARVRGTLVQPMQTGIAELIVGVTKDPVFGAVLTVGLGGVLTEIYKDTSHSLLPLDEDIVERMLRELKAFALLDGYRGRPRANLNKVCKAIVGIAEAAIAASDTVQEIEVNPLLVTTDGVVALDALIVEKIQ